MKKWYITWEEIRKRLALIDAPHAIVYGVPRGGAVCACLLREARLTENPEEATLILDDIIDSGQTRREYREQYPGKPFWAVVDKMSVHNGVPWVHFPWEHEDENTEFMGKFQNDLTRFFQMHQHLVDEKSLKNTKAAIRTSCQDSEFARDVVIAQTFLTFGALVSTAKIPISLGESVARGISKMRNFQWVVETDKKD